MAWTQATPNGGNSAKTGHRNKNNNASANKQTSGYRKGSGHPSAGVSPVAPALPNTPPPGRAPALPNTPPPGTSTGDGGAAAKAKAAKDLAAKQAKNAADAKAKAKLIADAKAAYDAKVISDDKTKRENELAAEVAAQDKADAEAKVIADDKIKSDAAAVLAKQISDAAAAKETQKRKDDEAVRLKAQADKLLAEKAIKAKAVADENAAIEAESQRLLAESEALTAATAKKAADDAAIAEAKVIADAKAKRDEERFAIVQEKRDGLISSETGSLATTDGAETTEETAEETSASGGLIDSFIPDFISESLKGEGNYSPEWVEKNKAAGAKHLESLYASGELTLPRSNFTDKNGNAIGGVTNSQDNVAMQEMAANGVEDPLSTLSKEVSDGTGLDTSFSGAFNQAINGADGHEYEGGSGLLNYANDQQAEENAVEGVSQGTVDKGLADAVAAEEAKLGETVKGQDGKDIPVDDLSSIAIDINKFSGNLGFATVGDAQAYWDSMSPEAQAIFNSKENPELSNKILTSVFGFMVPGFGLLNKFMYNDDMTLQEKLEFSNKTATTVANNKQNMKDGTNQDVADNSGPTDTAPPAEETAESSYSGVDSYLSIFNNYKF